MVADNVDEAVEELGWLLPKLLLNPDVIALDVEIRLDTVLLSKLSTLESPAFPGIKGNEVLESAVPT